jgi:hypothetical protein
MEPRAAPVRLPPGSAGPEAGVAARPLARPVVEPSGTPA